MLVYSVNDRFDQSSFIVFEKLESLLIKASKENNLDLNINDLVVELKIFETIFGNKKIEHFCDLTKEMKNINEPEKELIVYVWKIYRILAVNPVSSSTAKRTFPMAGRLLYEIVSVNFSIQLSCDSELPQRTN